MFANHLSRLLLLLAFGLLTGSSTLVDSVRMQSADQTPRGIAQAMRDAAWELRDSHPGKALQLMDHAQHLLEEMKGKKHWGQLAQIYNSKAVINRNLGNYPAALKLNQKSLKIAQEVKDTIQMGYACNDIAGIFNLQKDYTNALEFATKSEELFNNINYLEGYAYALHTKARIYDNIYNYQEALKYYQKALEIRINLGNIKQIASSYNNLGKAFFDLGNYEEAKLYHEKALHLADSTDNQLGVASSMMHVSKVHLQALEKEKAIVLLDSALTIVKKQKARLLEQQIYDQLALAYAEMGDYKKAYDYHRKGEDLQDGLFSKKVDQKIKSLHESFEIEMKERYAQQLKMEKSRKDQLQFTAIALIIIALFFQTFILTRTKISNRVLEYSVFFSFLLFFEFMLVLTDPLIEDYVNEGPLIKLAFNSALALIILPMHGYLETWLKGQLLTQREKRLQQEGETS